VTLNLDFDYYIIRKLENVKDGARLAMTDQEKVVYNGLSNSAINGVTSNSVLATASSIGLTTARLCQGRETALRPLVVVFDTMFPIEILFV